MTDNIKRDGAHVLVGTGRPLVSDFVPSGDMVSYPKDQTKCETIVTSWPCECAVRLARDGLRGNAPFTTDEADVLAKAVIAQHEEIERLREQLAVATASCLRTNAMHDQEKLREEVSRLTVELNIEGPLHVKNLERLEAERLEVSDYEAVNLLWLLRTTRELDLDTGDWHKQLLHKLEARGQGRYRDPNSSPEDTRLRLKHAAKKILEKP